MKKEIALHVGGRGNGLTTLMIDHAIQQARSGEHVEFWSNSFPRSEESFRLCLKRMRTTHQNEAVHKVYSSERTVIFMLREGKQGRISFMYVKHPDRLLGNNTSTVIQDIENYGLITREAK